MHFLKTIFSKKSGMSTNNEHPHKKGKITLNLLKEKFIICLTINNFLNLKY